MLPNPGGGVVRVICIDEYQRRGRLLSLGGVIERACETVRKIANKQMAPFKPLVGKSISQILVDKLVLFVRQVIWVVIPFPDVNVRVTQVEAGTCPPIPQETERKVASANAEQDAKSVWRDLHHELPQLIF